MRLMTLNTPQPPGRKTTCQDKSPPQIAAKLIEFLAQRRTSKKALAQKKFIMETNYCITLDAYRKSCIRRL